MISYQLVSMYLFVLLTALECTLVLSSTEEQSTLDSHVYKTLSVNKDQCELVCKEDPRCALYNYKLDKNAKAYCELNVCGMEEEHDISAALRKYRPSGSFIVSQTHQVRPVKNRAQCKRKLVCPVDYSGDGFTCKDMNKCRDGTHNCSQNANCTNRDSAFTCTCLEGYHGNGVTCYDIDECTNGTHNCSRNAICTNTKGSYNCTCLKGYIGNGVTCNDIDECSAGSHNCAVNANCTNTDGSFGCTCLEGYKFGDGVMCLACKSFNGSCYKYFDDKIRWKDAETKCASTYSRASLTSIHSSEENAFIRNLSSVVVWIGLTDTNVEGTFSWVDGTPLDYTNWGSGEPDNYLEDQDCTLLSPNKEWDDYVCSVRVPYICRVSL